MKPTDMPNLEGTTSLPETYSEEWRTREAMDIFDLLRNEYNNSKRLNVLKRYKEMERIIGMFTSEPVVAKLLWLSTESLHSAESEADEEEQLEGSQGSLEWQGKGRNSQEKVLDGIRNLSFRIKSSVLSASRVGLRRLALKQGLTIDTDLPSQTTSLSSPRSAIGFDNCYPQPRSCVSTPGGPLAPSECSNSGTSSGNSSGNSSNNSSGGKRFIFSVGSSSNLESMYSQSSSINHMSSDSNTSQLSVPMATASECQQQSVHSSRKSMEKRRGIEACVIKRDDVPAFQIPRQHVAPAQKSNNLIPALYNDNACSVHSTPGNRRPKMSKTRLHISMSAPNMIDRPLAGLGLKLKGMFRDNNQRERYQSPYSSNASIQNQASLSTDSERLSGYSTQCSDRKLSIPSIWGDQSNPAAVASILKGYDNLMQMKTEFSELQESNVHALKRYRKMKTIIKSCMSVY